MPQPSIPSRNEGVNPSELDVLTLIRSTNPASIGKRFDLVSGQIIKHQIANIKSGVAQSWDAHTAGQLASLLRQVSTQSSFAVCPSLWDGDAGDLIGEPFDIVTEGELARLTGRSVGSQEIAGVLTVDGRRVAARLRRGLRPSRLFMLDLDNPPGIYPEWAVMTMEQRIAVFADLVPNIDRCERVQLRGSSARVVAPGERPGGATHAYIRVTDPMMLATLKAYVSVKMVIDGLSFPSPRYSRTDGSVVGHAHRTVFDLAVWDAGRLIFCAKPAISEAMARAGYTVADANVEIVNAGGGLLDLSGFQMPDAAMLAEYQRVTGERVAYSMEGASLSVRSAGALTLATEIESRGVVRTFGEWLDTMTDGATVRCEAPFRASASEAAFMRRTGPAAGYVHDVGNATTYTLDVDAVRTAGIAELSRQMLDTLPADVVATVIADTPERRRAEQDRRARAQGAQTRAERQAGADAIPVAPVAEAEDISAVEILAHEFSALAFAPEFVQDADRTQHGHISRKQATTPARVQRVMRALELDYRMNVYQRQPLIRVPRAPWYDPAVDSSAASIGVVHHVCARCGMTSRGVIDDTLMDAASGRWTNPVLEWVQSVPWDGVSRFDELADTLEMADPSHNEWRNAVLRRASIQAVTAWRNHARGGDAVAVPYVLTLQGPQGIGKSRWTTHLLPAGWVKGDMSLKLDHNERDAVSRVTANPIVELAEVDASFRKSDVAALKNFLSTAIDKHRPPYGRRDVSTPRCTVFVATVNALGFLVDATGARRFWPLGLKACRPDHGIDMQQYWAEVLAWEDARFWLSEPEAALHVRVVESHTAETPVSSLVLEFTLAREANPDGGPADANWDWEGTSGLLRHAGQGHHPGIMSEFNERMRAAGFQRRTDDKKWRVPRRGNAGAQLGPLRAALGV